MEKFVSDFLNTVCDQISSKPAKLTARAELSGHITDIVHELLKTGMDETSAAVTAVNRMGDPVEIGRKIQRVHRPWIDAAAFAGGVAGLFALLIFMSLIWVGNLGLLAYAYDLPTLLFILLWSLALVLAGGVSGMNKTVFLRRLKTTSLYGGATGSILGIIAAAASLGDLSQVGVRTAIALISVLYGCVLSALSECLLNIVRPISADEINKALNQ